MIIRHVSMFAIAAHRRKNKKDEIQIAKKKKLNK